jgi:hypothetical protein
MREICPRDCSELRMMFPRAGEKSLLDTGVQHHCNLDSARCAIERPKSPVSNSLESTSVGEDWSTCAEIAATVARIARIMVNEAWTSRADGVNRECLVFAKMLCQVVKNGHEHSGIEPLGSPTTSITGSQRHTAPCFVEAAERRSWRHKRGLAPQPPSWQTHGNKAKFKLQSVQSNQRNRSLASLHAVASRGSRNQVGTLLCLKNEGRAVFYCQRAACVHTYINRTARGVCESS